ncbi:hypothetical protein OUZ56_007499 [Daphnia magna]|uniref:Uncharacterized protein n=1 Tax=Daphnia magna TaxID=35525 RepID=A0ABR0AA47_9CRUS|nr:hypothetical protein OUZ56_007499 [Daphnia magna]
MPSDDQTAPPELVVCSYSHLRMVPFAAIEIITSENSSGLRLECLLERRGVCLDKIDIIVRRGTHRLFYEVELKKPENRKSMKREADIGGAFTDL